MNYQDCHKLINNHTFKTMSQEACNEVMSRQGLKYNQWVLQKNGLHGLIDEHGDWCWRNTINTHPYCFLELYKIYLELGNSELDFFNDSLWYKTIKNFWKVLEENWLTIFTNQVEKKYYQILRFRTNKSWSVGQITTISFLYVFREIFEGLKFRKILFSLERGDVSDFMGIDVELITTTNENITIQVKSGEFKERTSFYSVTSSVNDLRSAAKYYAYVDIKETETKISVFKNNKNKIEQYDTLYMFPKELLVNKIITKNMEVPQLLNEILIFSAKNQIVFNLKNKPEEENKMEWTLGEENVVTIIIGDFKDENLPMMLSNKFKELQQLFQ